MAERSRRGIRRQISDTTDDVSEQSASESEHDWDPRESDSARRAGKTESGISPQLSRGKRTVSGEVKQGSNLKLKLSASKLREVTRANELNSLQDTLGGGKVIDGPRSRRAAASSRISARSAGRPRYAELGESDLEDEKEDEDEDDDVEDDEDLRDEEMNDYDELEAEAEGGTDDDDVDMEDAPPVSRKQNQPKPPKITIKAPAPAAARQGAKTKISVKAPDVGPVKSVEDQEVEDGLEDDEGEDDDDDDDDDDVESSELSEDEDVTNLILADNGEEPLDEDEAEVEEDDELDDDDSGDDTPGSGDATPDPAKLTKRQRGRPEDSGGLMALDMAPQQRKFFTDAEKAMKKDEHARKRKELTKRKINEEKTAALNRLLKPQASKARGAAPKPETLAAAAAAAATDEIEHFEKASPLYVRWISSKDGIRLGVPEEWLGRNVGKYFGPPPQPGNGALVQEL